MTEKKIVFLVDDSQLILDMTRAALEAAGYAVMAAVNLEELEKMRRLARPDLVVLDVQMPEAFGDELGEMLREVGEVRVPIVLFSAVEEGELAVRAEQAGLTGYVSKRAGIRALVDRARTLVPPGGANG